MRHACASGERVVSSSLVSHPPSAPAGLIPDAICELLLPLFEPFGPSRPLNLLEAIPKICHELAGTYDALKRVSLLALQTDAVAPAMSASLEWLKAVGGEELPTNFQELGEGLLMAWLC